MASSKSVVIAALIANGLIAITKFIGYLLTGSPSMLSETYHSISDTGNQVLLLTGIRYSKSGQTEKHPFGRGKSQFFYSFLVSVLLFGIAGLQSARHGYSALRDALSESAGNHAGQSDVIIQGINITELIPVETFWVNIGVLSVAFIFELWALYKANKGIQRIKQENKYDGIVETFRKTTDVTTLTAFTEDTVALIGIVVAFIGIVATRILENPIYDAATSLIIGFLLMFVAVALAWENKRLLLGESMEGSKRDSIKDIINSQDSIESIVDFKTVYFGPKNVLVTVSVEFKDGLSATDIEDITADLNEKIKSSNEDVKSIYIQSKDTESS